jgi:multiple sugar transport system permease protein
MKLTKAENPQRSTSPVETHPSSGETPADDERTSTRRARPRRPRGLDRGRRRLAVLLIAPTVTFMVLVHLVPTSGGVFLSFKNLNTFTFSQLFGAPWAGVENYRRILFDTANPLHNGFMQALRNTGSYTVTTVAGTLGGGLGLAVLLHRPFRGQRIVRTLMLAPWVVPSFVVGTLWQLMWQRDAGIINQILVDWTGFLDERPTWLLGSNSLWAIIIPTIWRGLPFAMLIFLAGLQAVPTDLHEAAAMDGAGPWRRFWHVTLPIIRPLLAIQLLFGVVYNAYQFTIPVVMLGSNPGANADLLMTLVVRQSFANNLVGFGTAASTLMTLGMLVWVAVWYRTFRRDLEVNA